MRKHRRCGPAAKTCKCTTCQQRMIGSAATAAYIQEEDKARKEAEFQAIKDLAELRRNPQKMAEYEKAVLCASG